MSDLRHNARIVTGCCVFGGLTTVGVTVMIHAFVEHAASAESFPGMSHVVGGMAFATAMMILGVELGSRIVGEEVSD